METGMSERVEFKLREKMRYIVTKFVEAEDGKSGSSVVIGEYPSEEVAFEVAYALAEQERINRGYSADDERIQYPKRALGFAVIGDIG